MNYYFVVTNHAVVMNSDFTVKNRHFVKTNEYVVR